VQLQSVSQLGAVEPLVHRVEVVIHDLVGNDQGHHARALRTGGQHGEERSCLWVEPLLGELAQRLLA
jgi:hypothetical protein